MELKVMEGNVQPLPVGDSVQKQIPRRTTIIISYDLRYLRIDTREINKLLKLKPIFEVLAGMGNSSYQNACQLIVTQSQSIALC